MKNIIKNITILVSVFVLSYFTAPYFGAFYDKFSPQYDFSFFNLQKNMIIFIAGLPVAYVFFVPFLFEIFGSANKRRWILWLLVLPALMWIEADRYYLYIPIILGLIGFLLARLILYISSKFKK